VDVKELNVQVVPGICMAIMEILAARLPVPQQIWLGMVNELFAAEVEIVRVEVFLLGWNP
jgi:hypothetical protein